MFHMHIDRKVLLFTALMLLGILIAMQGKGILNINRQKTSAEIKIEQYKEQLLAEREKGNALRKAIEDNEKKKEILFKQFAQSEKDDYRVQLGKALERMKIIAGLSQVHGKGVVVTLNDAPFRQVEDPNRLLIHQKDVYLVVNELKKAGAQAISINGERLIATSEQVCAGTTIRINKNRYPVPYEISAIGNPEILYKSLNESEIAIGLRFDNIGLDIKKFDDIIIPNNHEKLDDLIIGLEVLNK